MGIDLGVLTGVGGAAAKGYVEGTQRREALERSNRRADIQDEAAVLQLEELKKDQVYQDLTRKQKLALGALLSTGGNELGPMRDYIKSIPSMADFEDIQRAEDSSYTVSMKGGKQYRIQDMDTLGMLSMAATEPNAYLKYRAERDKEGRTDKREAMKRTFTDEGGYLHYLDEKNVARPVLDDKGKKVKAQTYAGKRLGSTGGNASADIQFLNWATEKLGIDEVEAMDMLFDLKHNPERALATIYSKRVESVEKNYFPNDPNKPSREQIKAEVMADMDEILGSTRQRGLSRGRKGKQDGATDMSGFMDTAPRAAGTGVTAFKYGVPGDSAAPSKETGTAESVKLPPKAVQALKNAGGKPVKFNNGQVWKLGPDGQPVRVQ